MIPKFEAVWNWITTLSLWRLAVLVFCSFLGFRAGTIATRSLSDWYERRPIAAHKWPETDLDSAGMKVRLKTEWSDLLRYQFEAVPRSDDYAFAFDLSASTDPSAFRFYVHLLDESGFELCSLKISPQRGVNGSGKITRLSFNGSDTACERKLYKRVTKWSVSWVAPPLLAIKSTDIDKTPKPEEKTPASHPKTTPIPSQRKSAHQAAIVPAPGDSNGQNAAEQALDELFTGYDYVETHTLETRSGMSFTIRRKGEQDVPLYWRNGDKLHIECQPHAECLIDNSRRGESVHATPH